MAVVFISPKQRQKMFFIGITIMFVLFLIVISFGVFLSSPKKVSSVLVFNKPKVNIDMGIFDSDQFKDLVSFDRMQTEYSYKAITKANKSQDGFITATSADEAKKALEGMGLNVSELKEVEIGRDNPFAPYGQTTASSKTTTK
jgi:predicted tellurium resistance membrane protein TerC